MKKIGRFIDLLNNPSFNITERSNIKEMRYEIKINNKKRKFIKLFKDDAVKLDNNKAFATTLTLGNYEKNNNLISEIEKVINFDNETFNYYARLKENNKRTINRFIKVNPVLTSKRFLNHLKEWINVCGIPNCFFDENNIFYLTLEDIKEILTFSKEILDIYDNFSKNNTEIDLKFSINYKFHKDKNDKYTITRDMNSIRDHIIFDILTYNYKESKYLKKCEYCQAYFFGRKDKLCCSQRCKDLKNGKYEKRKIRELEKQKGQEKTENVTNNQQK